MAKRILETRRLERADLPAVQLLHGVAKCDAPIGFDEFDADEGAPFIVLAERAMQSKNWQIFGAFYDLELVGVGATRRAEAVGGESLAVHIEALYVRPEFRRRGIGQLLLGEIADWAALLRASHVVCMPLPGAKRARRYLAKIGFSPGIAHRAIPTSQLQRRLHAPGSTRRRNWRHRLSQQSATSREKLNH